MNLAREALTRAVNRAIAEGAPVYVNKPEPFRTHTGDFVEGPRLIAALDAVANDWVALADAIRTEDAYASHVTDAEKEAQHADMLARAECIRQGEVASFTIWQRVNEKLTGECVALLR